jgi:hypothetical protein
MIVWNLQFPRPLDCQLTIFALFELLQEVVRGHEEVVPHPETFVSADILEEDVQKRSNRQEGGKETKKVK